MKAETDKAEKIVDLTYLNTIAKGNQGFIKEMVNLFLSETPAEVKSLGNGISTGDFPMIRASAHKLKSILPFVGIDKLILEDVMKVESLATQREGMDEIETRFMSIKEICEKACNELKQAA